MKKNKLLSVAVTIVLLLAVNYLNEKSIIPFGVDDILEISGVQSDRLDAPTDGNLTVRFIDVGQGDSELISLPDGRNILIDAGTTASETVLPEYLHNLGVEKLDYVIGTHPHEDHIGGLDAVINELDIGSVYMPRATSTTKTYKDVLTAVKNKGLQVHTASAGKVIIDEPTVRAELLAPCSADYEDLNNYSAVLKLTYGSVSFLFTGDAEKLSENEMLDAYKSKLDCDVLKVGHHGSSTSSGSRFLDAVSPSYAVISCAAGNDYGHPHKETVSALDKRSIKTYRTDINGTVTAVSDGNTVTFSCEK